MPVVVSCPFCSQKGRVPDDLPGNRVKCSKCGLAFEVPRGAATASTNRSQAPPPTDDLLNTWATALNGRPDPDDDEAGSATDSPLIIPGPSAPPAPEAHASPPADGNAAGPFPDLAMPQPAPTTRNGLPSPSSVSAPASPPPVPKMEWFYSRGGQCSGPVVFPVLKYLARSGQLAPTDLIWRPGMAEWEAGGAIAGLFPGS